MWNWVAFLEESPMEIFLWIDWNNIFYRDNGEPCITPAGFQFLLMDTTSQVWYFMLQYLETVEVGV